MCPLLYHFLEEEGISKLHDVVSHSRLRTLRIAWMASGLKSCWWYSIGRDSQVCIICMAWLSSMLEGIDTASSVNSFAFSGRFMERRLSLREVPSFIAVSMRWVSCCNLKSNHLDTHLRIVPHLDTTGWSFQGDLCIFTVAQNLAILFPYFL